MRAPKPEELSIAQRMHLIRQTADVLKQQPKNVTARYNYALLLKANKEYGPAIENLKSARKLAPKDMDILTMLAETCHEAKNMTLARKYARMLVDKFPKDVSCRMFYAQILNEMGKPEAANQQFDFVLKIEPDHAGVLQEKASAARMAGKTGDVEVISEKIGEIDPSMINSIYQSAYSRKNNMKQCEALENRIATALEKTEDDIDISQLNYSRGKIWSDVEEYDKAFKAYKLANEIRVVEPNDSHQVIMTNARNTFTKRLFKERERFGIKVKGPIFVLGMPRSGTTLTESILGTHSQIAAGDELNYLTMIAMKLGMDSPSHDAFTKTINILNDTEIGNIAREYLNKTKSLRNNTPYFTDKMPHNFLYMGLAKLVYPNVPIIHVRRHPIDNCLSIYTNSMNDGHHQYKSNLKTLGLYYRQYWRLMQHWRENIPSGFHEVYYEDVVANTELNARKMLEYIGLEWEDSLDKREKSQKSVRTLSAWQVRQPVYTSSAGRWRNYEKHLGPLIDALGPVVEEYESQLAALN